MTKHTEAPPLPHFIPAEKTVLGAILVRGEHLAAALEQHLTARDFFIPEHGIVFTAILELQKAGVPIDTLTVWKQLEETKQLSKLPGGVAFVTELDKDMPRVVNVGHYAKIIKEKAQLRQIIKDTEAIQRRALEGGADPQDLLTHLVLMGASSTNGNGSNGQFNAQSYALVDFIQAHFPPREHLIEGMIGRLASHMVIALPHRLKSWCTTALALGATRPGLLMGKLSVEKPVRTYLAQLEDWPGELQKRITTLLATQQFMGCDVAQVRILPRCDLDLTQDAPFEFLLRELKEFKPDNVILDVLRKFFAGDVNSPKETAAFLRRIDILQNEAQTSVTLVHHENRKKEEIMLAAAGSYNWAGWANVMIHFSRKTEARTPSGPITSVEIEVDSKLGPSPEPMRLILDTSLPNPLRLENLEDGTGFKEAMDQLGTEWDVKSLSEVLGVHRSNAVRRLTKWVEQGKVEKIRDGKRGRGRTMAMYRSLDPIDFQ